MLARSIIYDFASALAVKSWTLLASGGVCVQVVANQGCAHQTSPILQGCSFSPTPMSVIRIIEILIKGAFLCCSPALWLIINHTELSLGYPLLLLCFVMLLAIRRVCPLIFRICGIKQELVC